jgi:acyl-CoA dehydrogenase
MDDSAIDPRAFDDKSSVDSVDPYLADASIKKLADFFAGKGVAALKDEDRREVWYQDWLDYQARHRIYASVLSPKQYSSLGYQFDLLKLTRMMEVFGYFSPSHGYSLQLSFLGLFPILMGSNESLKREAVATLEAGGLFALGISEKEHGADLLSNEFRVTATSNDGDSEPRFVANGRKYYIGNSNCASIISILGRKALRKEDDTEARARRLPFLFMALRPAQSPGYRNVKKIPTLGVRSAFVGELEVKDHPVPLNDFIAEGRGAWDAAFGTVTLGKFFLGFGSIGICEHAIVEAVSHLHDRMLYRKSASAMPHIRLAMAQAYSRLFAMKLYAYRALDYVHAASETDRRYQLLCAVQKAKVSTQGVKVMAQLSECIGAKGFEADTYFESALRDAQLIPGLEGSTHINLGVTAQFIDRYFANAKALHRNGDASSDPASQTPPPQVKSLWRGDTPPSENPYLMQARQGHIADIPFVHFLDAYKPLAPIRNVRRFVRQIKTFARLTRHRAESAEGQRSSSAGDSTGTVTADLGVVLSLGECMATIAYAQLIAENATLFELERPLVSAIFHLLITDLSNAAQTLAALPELDLGTRRLARQMIVVPMTAGSDWNYVAEQMGALDGN